MLDRSKVGFTMGKSDPGQVCTFEITVRKAGMPRQAKTVILARKVSALDSGIDCSTG